jgi:hypothetical protein
MHAWATTGYAVALAACGTTPCDQSSCSDATATLVTTVTTGTGASGAAGMGAVGGTGGTGGAGGCSTLCADPNSLGNWAGPDLLWIGQGEDPVCPPLISTLLKDDLLIGPMETGPLNCGGCTCGPPQVTCDLSTPWEANADKCINVDAATPKVSFAAIDGWDGKCLSQNAIPAGTDCGGEPCVQSLTIPRPKVAGGCEPITPAWTKEITWSAVGKLCYGGGGFTGCDGKLCLKGPAPGFLMCMSHDDDEECNADWPLKVLTYRTVKDTRGCTPCTCDPPEGGDCSVTAAAYSTSACGTVLPPFPFPVKTSDSKDPCFNLPDGTALASKQMSVQTLSPGSCAPGGGESIGDVEFDDLVTFCCIPAE